MPMPRPGDHESREDFISRFMASEPMVSEFPDPKQRYAVAISVYRTGDKALDLGKIQFQTKDFVVQFNDVLETKAEDGAIAESPWAGTFSAIISTNTVDRDKEALLAEGADLSEYKANPILLKQHDMDSPIGRAEMLRKGSGMLHGRFGVLSGAKYSDTWNEIKSGVLGAVSVGFMTLESRNATPVDKKTFGEGVKTVISKWKLLEVSVVSVPANSEAIIHSVEPTAKESDHPNIGAVDTQPTLGTASIASTIASTPSMEIKAQTAAPVAAPVVEVKQAAQVAQEPTGVSPALPVVPVVPIPVVPAEPTAAEIKAMIALETRKALARLTGKAYF